MSDRAGDAALGAFAHATVGVADLSEALTFWTQRFGFEVAARRDGADADLSAVWDLPADAIARQALIRTPNAQAGALHLVEFSQPGAPVRRDAQVFDRLPKNLDIYVRDIHERFATLQAAGVKFRSEPVTSQGAGGMTFKEVHLAGHDDTNIVLLEIIGEGYDTCYNEQGFAGIGPLITIVPSLAAEQAFYKDALGMAVTFETRLAGPGIEKIVGLPPGAALLLEVYGDPREPLGRIEAIEYERSSGRNFFLRARPPALGTLHVSYRVTDLAPLLERLNRAGVAVEDHGVRRLLYGNGRVVSCRSPAGFRLELQEATTAVPR